MFCPECKTEYRRGFTKCADCGVDLVAELPTSDAAADEVPTNAEGLELLWSGTGQLGEAIVSGLEAAHTFHKVTGKGLSFLPAFPSSVGFIWIEPKDRVAARAILQKAFDNPYAEESRATDELAAESTRSNPLGFDRRVFNRVPDGERDESESEDEPPESDDSGEPTPDDIVEDFDPDDATTEVWAGDDKDMADYLKLCLGGVGIGCVIREDAGKFHVSVLPAQERRAREIVGEILDGTPPQ